MPPLPIALSTVGIVLIVLAAVLLLFFIGGLLAASARDRKQAGSYDAHVAEADEALEQARASDRGWDRAVMEAEARRALTEQRPGVAFTDLHLVLVDDRPGKEEDRAHFLAVGEREETKVVLARTGDTWAAERVE
jgi:hypothetical protein